MKSFITQQRPQGLDSRTRLGRIIKRLDGVTVSYCLRTPARVPHQLVGRGTLRIEADAQMVWCRVTGEIFYPNPFELAFHSFWLTRRGMILLVVCLLDEETPESQVRESFIQPLHFRDKEVQNQSRSWLRANERNRPGV